MVKSGPVRSFLPTPLLLAIMERDEEAFANELHIEDITGVNPSSFWESFPDLVDLENSQPLDLYPFGDHTHNINLEKLARAVAQNEPLQIDFNPVALVITSKPETATAVASDAIEQASSSSHSDGQTSESSAS